MNYQKIYNQLIERAKTRNKEDLTEFLNVHHIIPKHSGGTNDKNNLVVLTYKEHIFAHKLLFKIYANYLDQYAYLLMSSKTEEAMHELKKIAGKIGGKKAQELHGPKIQSAGGKVGGKISGKMNVESGHIQKLAKENQKLATECKKWSGEYVYFNDKNEKFWYIEEAMRSYPELTRHGLINRFSRGSFGFSRRLKNDEEKEYCKKQIEQLKSQQKLTTSV